MRSLLAIASGLLITVSLCSQVMLPHRRAFSVGEVIPSLPFSSSFDYRFVSSNYEINTFLSLWKETDDRLVLNQYFPEVKPSYVEGRGVHYSHLKQAWETSFLSTNLPSSSYLLIMAFDETRSGVGTIGTHSGTIDIGDNDYLWEVNTGNAALGPLGTNGIEFLFTRTTNVVNPYRVYTNGVEAWVGATNWNNSVQYFGPNRLWGSIQELTVWTNTIFTSADVAAVHAYATNTYGTFFSSSCSEPRLVTSKLNYEFLEGTGEFLWSSDGGTNGYGNGAWITGHDGSGYAMQFNGVSQYAKTAGNLDVLSNVMTICAWLRWDYFTNNNALLFETSVNMNLNDPCIQFNPNVSTNSVNVALRSGTGVRSSTFPQWSSNTWTHIAVVYDNSTSVGNVKLYVNGAEQTGTTNVNSKSGTANFKSEPLYIMSRAGTSLFAGGAIDDFHLYAGEITTNELALLITNPPVQDRTPLQVYDTYKLTNWVKYAGNPILQKAANSNDWDGLGLREPKLLVDTNSLLVTESGEIYMYFSGYKYNTPRYNRAIGLAIGTSETNWTKCAANPVLTNGAAGWDYFGVQLGNVIKIGLTNYVMYYSGVGDWTSGWGIGIANSADKTNWIKHVSNPVLTEANFVTTSDNIVTFPTVTILSDGSYAMVLSGEIAASKFALYCATSIDGYTWTALNGGNPIIKPTSGDWDWDNLEGAQLVEPSAGRYLMLFSGNRNSIAGPHKIGYSIGGTLDATIRTPYNPVISGTASSWDSWRVERLFILKEDIGSALVRGWYCGAPTSNGEANSSIGYVTHTP